MIETEAHVSCCYHQTPDVLEWQPLASVEVWAETDGGGWEATLLVDDAVAAADVAVVIVAEEEAEVSWEWRPSN